MRRIAVTVAVVVAVILITVLILNSRGRLSAFKTRDKAMQDAIR